MLLFYSGYLFLFFSSFGGNFDRMGGHVFAGHDFRAIVVVQWLLDEVAIVVQKGFLHQGFFSEEVLSAVYLSRLKGIKLRAL
uniref:Putative secreted protein n=1 Tax=Anopheles darlingi TaxID=43151 RepID=A0A2M4DDI3_ANODA